ncbi:MAG: M23 family metallopeptidase [Elusimicrobia bacterium]|nr:M23 family metallopeptidase [Elusimicrobiota bacterium]
MKKLMALCAAAAAFGCASRPAVTGSMEKAARQVLNQSEAGRKAVGEYDRYKKEFDRYGKLAGILRKYHDSKTLDDSDLLEVLRQTGVVKGAPAPKGKKPPGQFPVRTYKGGFRWPMDAGIVSSEFGPRWGKMHQGTDIAADMGVPIKASAAGEVIYSGDGISGYGNVVILRHDSDTTTTYAHNKALKVRVGEKVKAGQLIALLGSTGHSTGPHLHFEFRKGDAPVNPRTILPTSRF